MHITSTSGKTSSTFRLNLFYLALSSYLSKIFFSFFFSPEGIFIYFSPLKMMLLRSTKCQLSKISALARRETSEAFTVARSCLQLKWQPQPLMHCYIQYCGCSNPTKTQLSKAQSPGKGHWQEVFYMAHPVRWPTEKDAGPAAPHCSPGVIPFLSWLYLHCPLQRAK